MAASFNLAQPCLNQSGSLEPRVRKKLPEKEVLAQLEEAYARATVALTLAQKLCIIMGPLDMRGLLGAATVIGCLKYGAGVCGVHVSNQAAEVFLKDGSLNDGPDDEAFLLSLRRSLKTARGAYPPVALAEQAAVSAQIPLSNGERCEST